MNHRYVAVSALLFAALAAGAADRFSPTATSRHKVVASTPEHIAMLRDDGARLIAAYDAFSVFEVNEAGQSFYAKDPAVDLADAWYRIELNTGAIDTRNTQLLADRAATTTSRSSKGRRLHLVQFAAPPKPEWIDQLRADGWTVVDAIPQNALLLHGDAAALNALETRMTKRSPVQWHGAFLDADKVQPRAKASLTQPALVAQAESTYAVDLVLDPAANPATEALIDAIKLAPVLRRSQTPRHRTLIVKLPPDQIPVVAALPDVLTVDLYLKRVKFDERQDVIMAGQLAGVQPAGPGYLAWLASKGFAETQFVASGFVVDVTDSGLDNGTTNANHFGLYRLGDTGLASRVVYNRLEGTANAGSTLQGCDGHGNLNAHIIMGYNDGTGFPHEDSAGFNYGLGVCPFVKVGSSVIFDPSNFTTPDYEDLISRAYNNGARISGNSWGSDNGGGYDTDARAYDFLVRDAQPVGAAVVTAGNQEMIIVFANGNAGPTAGSVGSPATAKNVISVGAAENVHSHATTNGGTTAAGSSGCPNDDDTAADSAADMADFSSRGPCADGRVKPDLVAPGTHITGGVAQQNRVVTGTGGAITCFEGTGVCALPGGGTTGNPLNFFPQGQEFFTTSSGTSHSTPGVAGACALVRQWFLNNGLNAPSPAMTKAWLQNSARYMSGNGANDSLFSNNQGMGGVNLETAFDGTPRVVRDQVAADLFTGSGQFRTFVVQVVSNAKPLRVTLTWTDAPGSVGANAYVNNLDLRVTAAGRIYRGNVFSGAYSTNGGTADVRNNSESVFLPAGTVGTVAITVLATAISGDGVPNSGGSQDQDFALLIYNATTSSAAIVEADTAVLRNESCFLPSTNGTVDPGESVSVAFALHNGGNAPTTNVVATLLATNGVLSPGPAQSYGAIAAGATVTNVFTFTGTGVCGGVISPTLQLVDGATSLGNATFTLTLGARLTNAPAGSTNATPIQLVDNAAGVPYPSTITLSGLSGTVRKVTATLRGFTHSWASDADVLLVGPGGQSVVLMSGVGDGATVAGRTLTFDDDATSQLPASGIFASGTYQPSDLLGSAAFPGPAPSAPYGQTLSVFAGTSPNGTWSLYALDSANEDTGIVTQGWAIQVETTEPRCCGRAPPFLPAVAPKTTALGTSLTFQVTATQTDGDALTLSATNLPGGATFTPAGTNGTFNWAFPSPAGVYTTRFTAVDADGPTNIDVVITVTTVVGGGNCGIIISEYVEGSALNKALEIYNGGSMPVDLSAEGYVLQVYENGSTAPTNALLSGLIPGGGTWVTAYFQSSTSLLAKAQHTNTLNFTGDDAVVLRSGGTNGPILDSIGQVGSDPGLYWGLLGSNTLNNTLRRKATVLAGDTVATNAFSPADEWTFHGQDNFADLGVHLMNCQSVSTNDTDGDGIADYWELLYFANLTQAGAATDLDGDGFTDAQEFLLGTSPVDPGSLLKISQQSAVTNSLVIRWPSASNRLYRITSSTNLLDPAYAITATNIAALPPVNVYTTPPLTGAVQRVFRVELQTP